MLMVSRMVVGDCAREGAVDLPTVAQSNKSKKYCTNKQKRTNSTRLQVNNHNNGMVSTIQPYPSFVHRFDGIHTFAKFCEVFQRFAMHVHLRTYVLIQRFLRKETNTQGMSGIPHTHTRARANDNTHLHVIDSLQLHASRHLKERCFSVECACLGVNVCRLTCVLLGLVIACCAHICVNKPSPHSTIHNHTRHTCHTCQGHTTVLSNPPLTLVLLLRGVQRFLSPLKVSHQRLHAAHSTHTVCQQSPQPCNHTAIRKNKQYLARFEQLLGVLGDQREDVASNAIALQNRATTSIYDGATSYSPTSHGNAVNVPNKSSEHPGFFQCRRHMLQMPSLTTDCARTTPPRSANPP